MQKDRHICSPIHAFQFGKLYENGVLINYAKTDKWHIEGIFDSMQNLGVFYLPLEYCKGEDREACCDYNGLRACKYKVTEMNEDAFKAYFYNHHTGTLFYHIFRNDEWVVEGNVLKSLALYS